MAGSPRRTVRVLVSDSKNHIQKRSLKGKAPKLERPQREVLLSHGEECQSHAQQCSPFDPNKLFLTFLKSKKPITLSLPASRWPGGRGHRSTAWLYGDDSAVCWSPAWPYRSSHCLAMGCFVRCKGWLGVSHFLRERGAIGLQGHRSDCLFSKHGLMTSQVRCYLGDVRGNF